MLAVVSICIAVLLTGASAGGPGDCGNLVTATASIFEEGELNLENFISIENDRLQKEFDDAKASGWTKEQFIDNLNQLGIVASDNYNSIITNISISLEAATNVNRDIIYNAIFFDNVHEGPLSCISTQLAQLLAKILELAHLYTEKTTELLESY